MTLETSSTDGVRGGSFSSLLTSEDIRTNDGEFGCFLINHRSESIIIYHHQSSAYMSNDLLMSINTNDMISIL